MFSSDTQSHPHAHAQTQYARTHHGGFVPPGRWQLVRCVRHCCPVLVASLPEGANTWERQLWRVSVCVFVFEGYCTCFGMAVRGIEILGLPIFNTRVVARMTLLGERLQNAEPGLLSLSCVWGVRLAQHVAWPRGHRGFDRAMGQFSPCQADVEVTGDSARAFSTEECQTQSLPAVGTCKHAQGPSISLFE